MISSPLKEQALKMRKTNLHEEPMTRPSECFIFEFTKLVYFKFSYINL